jgi:hypothetical protein
MKIDSAGVGGNLPASASIGPSLSRGHSTARLRLRDKSFRNPSAKGQDSRGRGG